MSSILSNTAILAAAGSRKTEHVVESALRVKQGRVLIATYTNENKRHIINRIEQKVGTVPANIVVTGWFTFLIGQCAKPYQRALTDKVFHIQGLNFKAQRNRFTKKTNVGRYFFDRNADMYRDGVADFVVELNRATDGAVIKRLERIYSHIFIDEMQDLVGYDLDVLDLLFASTIRVLLVGDPRQHMLATNCGSRHKKYRGKGQADWLAERKAICTCESRMESYRCNQGICDFADALFPEMPKTVSVEMHATGHDGIFTVTPEDVPAYCTQYDPVTVLRHDRTFDTLGLPSINIGVAKGRTFDRVIIFPTRPMLAYLRDKDPTKLKAPEKLYIAVTRARYSVTFVVPDAKE